MLGNSVHVFVDGDYRNSGSSGDFVYSLGLPANLQADSVAVLSASIPKSYYLISQGANTFTLTEGVQTATIEVPKGNYSMASFRTVLQGLINAASPHNYTYAITQPNTTVAASTAKYTFTVSGNGGVQPNFTFPSTSLVYKQMGFDWTSSNNFVANSLVSTNCVNFNNVRGLIIKSNLVNSTANNSGYGSTVLQEIYNFNTSDFSNIGFQNNQVQFSAKPMKTGAITDSATFTIVDTDDRILDFNGDNVNLSLVFFKKDNYHEAALQDLKIKWTQDVIESGVKVNLSGDSNVPPQVVPQPPVELDSSALNPSGNNVEIGENPTYEHGEFLIEKGPAEIKNYENSGLEEEKDQKKEEEIPTEDKMSNS